MTQPMLLTAAAFGLLLLIFLLLLVLWKKMHALQRANSQDFQQQLLHSLQANTDLLKEGFSEARKELREVSAENRRESQELFKRFQDTLLHRIAENASLHNRQLAAFREDLQQLSEKLMQHGNDFRQNVMAAFQASSEALNGKQDQFIDKTGKKLDDFAERIKMDGKDNRRELNEGLKAVAESFTEGIRDFNDQLRVRFSDLQKQQLESSQQAKAGIQEISAAIEKQLQNIREDNTRQLTEMRRTVDEKLHDTLEKRLGESFKQVSERLEQVHKGLGEMQNLAVGVGDLKKVLSNVKTRGILGEYQLGNILEQILSPEQYAVNVATKQGSQANVEYAVKLPGKADDKTVWLPIDSKFPMESHQMLLQAVEEGSLDKIAVAQKQLLRTVESFARDISSKYIDPPHTTDFAIMFLPVESLYAEVLRHPQVFAKLQREYRITITGPTTLSALLSSLHMGFRTLAVQKRSSEVWKVLAEVKTEFGKYSEQLDLVHKHLHTASSSLEKLQTTRTNAMARKLKNVEVLEVEGGNGQLPPLQK